jgi:hypothetical protein
MRLHALPPPLHLLPSFISADAVSCSDLLSNRRVLWLAMRLTEAAVKALDRISALELLRYCASGSRRIEYRFL